jgi:hydroxymethylbilane synthase
LKSRLVLGSRGSALALAQVKLVREALLRSHPGLEVEVKIITTSGDRRQDAAARHRQSPDWPSEETDPAGLKGLFTKEIQEALLTGSIDAAVHSLKDLPGATPPSLIVAAVLPRADPSDLLISPLRPSSFILHPSSFALPPGARIGTSSVRRRRQLLWLRSDLQIVDLRGNVPTRLQKLTSLSLDAIVLARAGIERLGYTISGDRLECDAGAFQATPLDILPAIGQGVIGLESRREDTAALALLSSIDHLPTHTCIRVERELLRLLDGDCRLPVAARVTLLDSATLQAAAIVFPADESLPPAQAQATSPASVPESLAQTLFQQLSPESFPKKNPR